MPRQLALQLQVSVDMYMATSDKNLSFLGTPWSEDLSAYITAFMKPVDSMILGRKLAAGFIPHWLNRPGHEDAASIDKINSCHKTIFSRSLTEPDPSWISNEGGKVEMSNENLVTEVARLKNEEGGKLVAFGGVQFVQELMAADGLVDELLLIVNPTALGQGQSVFQSNGKWQLLEAQRFECGLLALKWQPPKA